MKLQTILAKLGGLSGVQLAQGDVIPSPTKEAPPSLYINIIYRSKLPGEADTDFLNSLRKCALHVLAEIAPQLTKEPFRGACVSFFHIPEPGSNIRIYRVHPLREQIEKIINGEMPLEAIEESRHPDLRKLVGNTKSS